MKNNKNQRFLNSQTSNKKFGNKKAILLPEFLKLLIAVAVIFMLVFLAYQLYSIFIAKSDLEKAKETLNQITSKIEGLDEGESFEYLITSPGKWGLVSFSKKEMENLKTNLRVGVCGADYCLCMCKEYLVRGYASPQYQYPEAGLIETCNKEGACKSFNEEIYVSPEQNYGGEGGLTYEYPHPVESIVIEKLKADGKISVYIQSKAAKEKEQGVFS